MSPVKDHIVRRLKLHVKLHAPGPGERFAVLGSHEALGCWNPSSGLQLEWKGNAWETSGPVPISPCERVEFKFARFKPGGLEWESGPNRVTEFPNYPGHLCLQGIFNGESILQPTDLEFEEDSWAFRSAQTAPARPAATQAQRLPLSDPFAPQAESTVDTTASIEEDEDWRARYETALSMLLALQHDIAMRQQEQDTRRTRRNEVVEDLRRQIAAAQAYEAELLSEAQPWQGLRDVEQDIHPEAPDIAAIPSPSFASSASWQSSPGRSAEKSQMSQSSSQRMKFAGLHVASPRLGFQGEPQAKVRPKPSQPQVQVPGPVGHHGSVLETWRSERREPSEKERALAAIQAARGASPATPRTPGSQDEPSSEGQMSGSSAQGSASASKALRKGQSKEENSSPQRPADQRSGGKSSLIASKEVAAAFATARARCDEAGAS
ncbi:unnamed protein product [Effrenium voratum]|nr:unnamed protein product [Effrenium voratum]